MGTRLFIGNLSYAVTEQELREAFTGDGIELRSVRVALDRETGRPRGFAFVETMTDEGAKASIEKLSGRVLQGRADHRRGGAGQTGRTTPGRLRRRAAPGGSAAAAGGPAARRPRRPSARPRRPAPRPAASADRPGRGGGPPRRLRTAARPGWLPARRARPAAAGARDAPPRGRASGPKRRSPRGPSRKSRSVATGGGTATPTTSSPDA